MAFTLDRYGHVLPGMQEKATERFEKILFRHRGNRLDAYQRMYDEIGRRVAAHRLAVGDPIQRPEDVHRHFYLQLRSTRQERFIALLLDGRHRLLGEVLVTRGTLTASLVHPREVFRSAVREAAAALL